MVKRMMYNKMKRKLQKKASEHYAENFETNEIILEAFNKQDILIVVVCRKNGKPHTDKLKLSEYGSFLDIFISRLKKDINNFKEPIYTKLTIDFENKKELLQMTYFDEQGNKHPFNYEGGY